MKRIILFFGALLCLFVASAQVGNQYFNKEPYNVLNYGLVGDSVTDNTTAFRNMLASLPGGEIYFPKGYFLFSDSIIINKAFTIRGSGYNADYLPFYLALDTPNAGSTTILFSSGTKNFFKFAASATNKSPVIQLLNLSIRNTAASAPTAGAGVTLDSNIFNPLIRDVSIKGFWVDVQNNSSTYLHLNHDFILAPYYAGVVQNNTAVEDAGWLEIDGHTLIMSGVDSVHKGLYGVYIKGGGAIRIHDCDFNAQGVYKRKTQFGYFIYADWSGGATSDVDIHDLTMESYDTTAIKMVNLASAAIYNINIHDNEIGPYNQSNTGYPAIDIEGNSTFKYTNVIIQNITGIMFNNPPWPMVYVTNTNNLVVKGLIMSGTGQWTTTDSIVTSNNLGNIDRFLGTSYLNSGSTSTPTLSNYHDNLIIQPYNYTFSTAPSSVSIIPKGANSSSCLNVFDYDYKAASGAGTGNYLALTGTGSNTFDISSLNVGTPISKKLRLFTKTNNTQLILDTLNAISSSAYWTFTNTTSSTNTTGLKTTTTSSGSTGTAQSAWTVNLAAGYTGTASSLGIIVNNAALGAGNTIAGAGASIAANIATYSYATGANGSSTNMGTYSTAYNNLQNLGVFGDATVNQYNSASAVSGGILGIAKKNNSGAKQFAGGFSLSATPTLYDAALWADNSTQTSPIFNAYANGTLVFGVASTGILTSNKMLTATGTPTIVTHQSDSSLSQITLSNLLNASTTNATLQNVTLNHLILTGTVPISSGLGTNVTSVTPSGHDGAMQLVVVTSGNVTGTICTITYNTSFTNNPYCVIASANSTTGSATTYIVANGTAANTATVAGSITGAGTYTYTLISVDH